MSLELEHIRRDRRGYTTKAKLYHLLNQAFDYFEDTTRSNQSVARNVAQIFTRILSYKDSRVSVSSVAFVGGAKSSNVGDRFAIIYCSVTGPPINQLNDYAKLVVALTMLIDPYGHARGLVSRDVTWGMNVSVDGVSQVDGAVVGLLDARIRSNANPQNIVGTPFLGAGFQDLGVAPNSAGNVLSDFPGGPSGMY
jgi:hypothetical protein